MLTLFTVFPLALLMIAFSQLTILLWRTVNDDPDAPIFGVGRKSVRNTGSHISTTSSPGSTGGEVKTTMERKNTEGEVLTASPGPAPRRTLIGAVLRKLSSKQVPEQGPPKIRIIFDDTGDLERMSEYLKQGGDVNHVFPGKDPWAFLYGERPSLLIATCYWVSYTMLFPFLSLVRFACLSNLNCGRNDPTKLKSLNFSWIMAQM